MTSAFVVIAVGLVLLAIGRVRDAGPGLRNVGIAAVAAGAVVIVLELAGV